jgi:hypothetical protein
MSTMRQTFEQIRLMALAVDIVALVLLVGLPIGIGLKLGAVLLALLGLAMLASMAAFPSNISLVERVGLSGLLLFVLGGVSGLALGLSPLNISQESALLMLCAETLIFWLIAEVRIRRVAHAATYQPASLAYAIGPTQHMTLRRLVIAAVILASSLGAILYVVDQFNAPIIGYTELSLGAVRRDNVEVEVANNEGHNMTYRLISTLGERVVEVRDIKLEQNETLTVLLRRLDGAMTVSLYKGDDTKAVQSVSLGAN